MAGSFGGGGDQAMQLAGQAGLEKSIGNMANQYRQAMQTGQMSDYRAGQGNQLQAGSLAGQLSQDDWTAANNLMNMGTQEQNYTNQLAGIDYKTFQDQQNYPQTQLQNYINMLSQASGAAGTTTNSAAGASPWAGLLGGAGAGVAAYNLFK